MRLLLVLLVGFTFVLSSCKSVHHHESGKRDPSSAVAPVEHNHNAPDDIANSAEFREFEAKDGQHTFVVADFKGHFGSHFTQFQSRHQHQVFVRMSAIREGFTEKDMQALYATSPTNYYEKYWSLTTNKPIHSIRSIFEANMPYTHKTGASLYDGLIASPLVLEKDKDGKEIPDNSFKVDPKVKFQVLKVLYTHPMIASEQRLVNSTHILFGSYGADKGPKAEYSMAHLIQGADNYEQLMRVTLSQPIAFDDYALLSIDVPDSQMLELGKTYDATLKDGTELKVTISHEFYHEVREI